MAEQIDKKGEVMGPRGRRRRCWPNQVLQELNGGGRVSKKTKLAVDDAARRSTDEQYRPADHCRGDSPMICPACGFENEDGVLFCEKCKADLDMPAAAPSAQADAMTDLQTTD